MEAQRAPLQGQDVLERRPGLFVQEAGGEKVLVPVEADVADLTRVWTLSATAAAVWDLVDGVRSVDGLVAALQERYRGPAETIERDVRDLLSRMLAQGLVRRIP